MQVDLTRGGITRPMLAFAAPMIAGNLLQQCYNIADTLIVGRALGPAALASVGFAFRRPALCWRAGKPQRKKVPGMAGCHGYPQR